MMKESTHDRINRLEQRLVADGHTVDDLCAAYSVYLLSLLSRGILTVASHAYEAILASLRYSATLGSSPNDKQAHSREMTAIELSSERTGEVTSVFAKCARNCLYDQSDWDADNDGSDTPLFYYLYHLEPLVEGVADDFFAFFHHYFNLVEAE